jgi:hypothetical protein
MKLLTLLIAAALCGQAQSNLGYRHDTICGKFDASGKLIEEPCSPSIEERVERLEKAVEKLQAPQASYYQPSSSIAFYDPVERKVRSLTREEANALLVALANAINEASAKRAAESK